MEFIHYCSLEWLLTLRIKTIGKWYKRKWTKQLQRLMMLTLFVVFLLWQIIAKWTKMCSKRKLDN